MRILLGLLRLPGFTLWFLGQMVRANAQVAADILTPGSNLTPGLVAYRATSRGVWEVALLSNLLTLTPGTLTVDMLTDDGAQRYRAHDDGGAGPTLYVLGLYAPEDPDRFRAELGELEERMLRMTRGLPPGAPSPLSAHSSAGPSAESSPTGGGAR